MRSQLKKVSGTRRIYVDQAHIAVALGKPVARDGVNHTDGPDKISGSV